MIVPIVDAKGMPVGRWVIGGLLTLMMGGILASVLAQGAWNRVRARPLDMTEVQHRIGIPASKRPQQ
jgi:hypothetical protein